MTDASPLNVRDDRSGFECAEDSFCRLKPPYTHSTLLWKMNTACNLRCLHCLGLGQSDPAVDLDAVLADIVESGLKRVVITGGEPLLHSALQTVVEQLTAHGLVAVVLTNGTLLSAARAGFLRQAGVQSLVLSLHSHRPKLHDEITQCREALARVTAAMAHCRNEGIPFSVSMVVLPFNEGEIGDLIDFCFEQKASSVAVNSLIPFPGVPGHLRDWVRDWDPRRTGDMIIRKRQDYGPGRIRTSGLLPAADDLTCPAGKSFWGITEAGKWNRCLPAAEYGLEKRAWPNKSETESAGPLLRNAGHNRTCPLLAGTRSRFLYAEPRGTWARPARERPT